MPWLADMKVDIANTTIKMSKPIATPPTILIVLEGLSDNFLKGQVDHS